MTMKEKLQKMISDKEAQLKALRERSQKSEDVKELRALNEDIDRVIAELNDIKEMYTNVDKPADEQPATPTDENAERSLTVLATMETRKQNKGKVTDKYDTEEYRKAFMEFVCRGTAIPAEYRQDQVTTTTDASAVIPTTLLNEIIKELKSYGNLYSAVRKLNVQGGVNIPILSLKPTATWIGETTGSDDQKLQANTSISFSYFGLECKIAQTLLASVVTLEMFQEQFIPLAAEAMAKALDNAIMNGTGSTQPTGITKDSRVPSGNTITLASTDFTSWAGWKKKVFAKMKKSYRNGKFYMAQSTFDGYIDGMVDSNGQPIGRVNYGIDGAENYRFGGKDVETVEDDIIKAYDDASASEVVAVFVNLKDYAINSNMTMQTVKWTDHDTNEIKNKVIMICDGKLVDPNGVLIIKKGA